MPTSFFSLTRSSLFALLLLLGTAICPAADELRGRIESFELRGQASGMDVTVQVYLPPGYSDTQAAYPIVYFLHGSGGVTGIAQLARSAEKAVAAQLCRPFLIAEPKGPGTPRCFWVDDLKGKSRASTLVSTDVRLAVEGRYRTLNRREGRVIAGFSMGGFGAMAQLFEHPELYATAVAFDGAFIADVTKPDTRLRSLLDRVVGQDDAAFLPLTPQGRAAAYAKRPAAERPPIAYLLPTGPLRDRSETLQAQLNQLGVGQPDRILVTKAGHNLGQVLEQCWHEVFTFLGQRLAQTP